MMNKLNFLVVAVLSALAGCYQRSRGLIAAANTYDAAVETHEAGVRRTLDVAATARHLLWAQGATDAGVAINTASDVPLGPVDNIAAQGAAVTVQLLGRGPTKKMVAGGEVDAGDRVFAAAGGKVVELPAAAGTYKCVGVALTGAGADDDIIEVNDCVPFDVEVPA